MLGLHAPPLSTAPVARSAWRGALDTLWWEKSNGVTKLHGVGLCFWGDKQPTKEVQNLLGVAWDLGLNLL